MPTISAAPIPENIMPEAKPGCDLLSVKKAQIRRATDRMVRNRSGADCGHLVWFIHELQYEVMFLDI